MLKILNVVSQHKEFDKAKYACSNPLATTLVMEQRYNLNGLATGSSAVTAGTVLFILQ